MEKAGTKGYTFLNLDDPPPYEPPGNEGQWYQPCQNYRQPYPGQQPDEGQLQCIVQQQYGLQPYREPTHVPSQTTVIETPPEVSTTMYKPPDFMLPSILVCFCCCSTIGWCAIYAAHSLAAAAGEMEAAKKFSRKARNLVITGFVIGVMWFGIVTAITAMKINKK